MRMETELHIGVPQAFSHCINNSKEIERNKKKLEEYYQQNGINPTGPHRGIECHTTKLKKSMDLYVQRRTRRGASMSKSV